MLLTTHAFARAGLVGNPSDGYFGKTISFIVRNFRAQVQLYESPEVAILPNHRDESVFSSIDRLVEDVGRNGYYGGVRLLKATIKRFYDYCRESGVELHGRNFTVRYQSNIPEQVGLAGSSAIITACLRALMAFYGIEIPKAQQANLVLSVETRELGIPAGLQDRVIQVYEGVVFMDFDRRRMEENGCGRYEELDPALLPPLYVAFRKELSEGTEIFHNDIRGRFNRGEPAVLEAMAFWASLAQEARDYLLAGEKERIGGLLNANFDKRRELYRISEANLRMVETARSVGASAKFTGSGGAIVGTYEDEEMFVGLNERMRAIGVEVLKPIIAPSQPDMEKVVGIAV